MAINSRDRTESELEIVSVVYYLTRNGQLEHSHFIEVPLSSSHGLLPERSYKNGSVWEDLSEIDFIHPSHGHDYILKGSELIERSVSFGSYETVLSSSTSENSSETSRSGDNSICPRITKTRNNSWRSYTSNDIDDHRVKRARAAGGFSIEGYNNMSTQTGEENMIEGKMGADEKDGDSDGSADIRDQTAENDRPSGRIKASEVLMQLIACGSRKVKASVAIGNRDRSFI